MKIELRYIDLLGGLILLALFIAGILLNYTFHADTQRKAFLRQQFMVQQETKLNRAQTNLTTLRQVLDDQKAALTLLDHRIPDSAQVGSLLEILHDSVRKRNVELSHFKHQPPVKVGRYHRIPLTLSFEGSFIDIYSLVHELETLNRLFIIDTIQIIRPEGKKTCDAVLTASIFSN
jgi:Tfp pilus assembly protein PilO